MLSDEAGRGLGPVGEPRQPILVIDDDATMRKSLEIVLGKLYKVTMCASAAEGVNACNDEICTAVIDVKMKGHDGFWACGQLRNRFPDLPVIFYSAFQDVKDPYEIINEYRPFAYIIKDGDTKRLLSSIDLAVSTYRVVLRNKKVIERLKNRPSRAQREA